MKRFIEGEARTQATWLPELVEDYIAEGNPVRVIDVFVDELDLGKQPCSPPSMRTARSAWSAAPATRCRRTASRSSSRWPSPTTGSNAASAA